MFSIPGLNRVFTLGFNMGFSANGKRRQCDDDGAEVMEFCLTEFAPCARARLLYSRTFAGFLETVIDTEHFPAVLGQAPVERTHPNSLPLVRRVPRWVVAVIE